MAEDAIERAAVVIYPDLTGFRKKLQADLKKAVADINATVKIKLIADKTGFAASVREQLKLVKTPEFKVKVVADTSAFEREVARLGAGRATVRVGADTRGASKSIEKDLTTAVDKAAEKAERILYSRIREPFEKGQQGELQAYAADIVNRVRVPLEAIQRAEVQAYAESARLKKAADDKKAADEKKLTGTVERESKKRATAAEAESKRAILAADRALKERRKAAEESFTPPKLINFGGEGIRPTNLLYAALAALSPLLISVGSSAVQAGAGIAALGAAGIGAGLAIGGLVVAFQGISNALKLRKTTLAETATATQNSAATATMNAAEELRQKNALLDTAAAQLKAEKDLSDARKEAARDLETLKNKVRDLQNQEKGDKLTLAEAKAKQASVNANFFATALDKARAAQDVADAKTKLGDTQLDRKQATQDLAAGVKKGVEGSDKVAAAKEALRLARERRAEALADKAASSLADTAGKVSSPLAQLNQQIADLSPAARGLYQFFVDNDKELKHLQKTIESGVLPGFTRALKKLAQIGPDGKSSFRIAANAAGLLGGKVGDLVDDLAKITQDKGFRKDFQTIIKNDSKAMDLLNAAVTALVKPFTQIFAASSPLLVRFAGYIKDIADRFAAFIDDANQSGRLAAFFKRSGDELARWAALAKQVSRLLLGLFTGSVQSGGTVIDRLTTFFKTAADWANSGAGQTAIRNFFDKLAALPFGKIRDFAVQLGILFSAAQIARFGLANPFFTTLSLFAKSNPDAALKLLTATSDMVLYLSKHEALLQTLLAVLTAYRLLKGVGAIKLTLGAIPGLDKLLPSLTRTATMTVQAGVVNVYGAAGIPGAVTGAAPAAAAGATKVGAVLATGLTVAGGIFGASLVVDAVLGKSGSAFDGLKSLLMGPESYAQWSKENAPAFQRFFSMTLPGFITAGGTRGWSSFKDAFYNTFGDNVSHFFSITLPNAINLGSGGSGGYAGLVTNLGKFFSTTLPNSLSGGTGGWSGLGKYTLGQARMFIGMQIPSGISEGIDNARDALFTRVASWAKSFWKFLRGLFGVNSPSTLTAQIGGWLVDGLYNGFTQRWSAVWKTLAKWIDTNITTPLTTTFGAIGGLIKQAFTHPFTTLTNALAAPIKAAFNWLNSFLIAPLNALLGKIGVSPIALLTVSTGSSPGTGAGVGGAIGGVVGIGAGLLNKADGGTVPGSSPHSRADNIPAMLTANEYVQPVAAVKHYGTEFMDAVRTRTFDGYADGGLVGGLKKAQGSNLATEIITGALKGVTLKGIVSSLKNTLFGGGGSGGGGSVTGDLSVERIAESTARAMGATDKELVSLFEAGFVESEFRNVPGGDRDSVGFLQQRPSQGWGTPNQILNVAHATTSFIRRLKKVDHTLTPGLMAQAVQNSGFPLKYDKRFGDAVAALNLEAPYLAGYTPPKPGSGIGGAAGGLFGPWPASPQVDHGHDSGVWRKIIQLVAPTGLDRHSYGSLYDNRRTDTGNWSWHSDGHAVDFGGENQDKLANFFEARKSHVLELIHRSDTRDYGIKRGSDHEFGAEFAKHRNHIHVAMNSGGLVPARKYDSGGTLPPGFTMAYNGTGKNETIRTSKQEASLNGPMRLDRRDIALLAAHIAQANNQAVIMDGRKVAEITNSYTYLPAGV